MLWSLRLSATAGLVLLASCNVRSTQEPVETETPSTLPSLPVSEAPLSREDILLAAMRAGSAAAGGRQDSEAQRRLEGKRFELRMRFGCGDTREGATRTARFDADSGSVALAIPAEIDLDTPVVGDLAPAEIEAAEGFWIRRPWLLEPACAVAADKPGPSPGLTPSPTPTVSPSPAATSTVAPRIAIVQFFTDSDARTHRRQRRAYQAVEKLVAEETPGASGYDLVIEGRLQALPGGKVITCKPQPDRAPTCVISARFDLVSLERGDTGELVAEWPSG